jgi:hypothetical protein
MHARRFLRWIIGCILIAGCSAMSLTWVRSRAPFADLKEEAQCNFVALP